MYKAAVGVLKLNVLWFHVNIAAGQMLQIQMLKHSKMPVKDNIKFSLT